jgi:hypothetical protein|tara:strand:+ start:853 stop:993 length:141 start_codon:yes stop_codon:yes gene_type:complete
MRRKRSQQVSIDDSGVPTHHLVGRLVAVTTLRRLDPCEESGVGRRR